MKDQTTAKTITTSELDAIEIEVEKELHDYAGKIYGAGTFPRVHVRIDYNFSRVVEGVEVNWSAIGAVTADDAQKFAAELANAIAISKRIEASGIVGARVTYDD